MKVLAINSIYYVPISGINQNIKGIGKELTKAGHEYTVLTLKIDKYKENINEKGIKIVELPFSKYNTIIGNESLDIILYLIKNLNNYDIVTIHNYYSFWSLISALICKLMRKPYVFISYYHGIRGNIKKGISTYTYDLFGFFGRYIFKWADKVICISQHEKNLIETLTPIQKDKIQLIPPGVSEITLNRHKKSQNGIISLLYVGNLFESKGVQHILYAIHSLKERYNVYIKFSIVGDGIYKSNLVNLIDELSLTDYVDFSFDLSQKDLNQKYKEADIFVFLSCSEAYGMVVAEALAMGTPCIIANEMALSEFTNEPGCFGVDFPPNPKKVAKLILEIYKSDVIVGPFSDKIRTWDKVAESYETVFFNLLREAKNEDN